MARTTDEVVTLVHEETGASRKVRAVDAPVWTTQGWHVKDTASKKKAASASSPKSSSTSSSSSRRRRAAAAAKSPVPPTGGPVSGAPAPDPSSS